MTNTGNYDLEERTAKFGEAIITLAKKIPVNQVTRSLIHQIVRLATSVGANYCEADDASTKKEFRQKYWLLSQGSAGDETLVANDRESGTTVPRRR